MKSKAAVSPQERMEHIRDLIEAIPAMLDGELLIKHNRVKRKDGSVHISPAYYSFQYRDINGKRHWKRIPGHALNQVKKLVNAAKRYRLLEREFRTLCTELTLADPDKKKA